ncbi:MAG: sulfatase [Candidatus Humimicrobiaceae bacterium]
MKAIILMFDSLNRHMLSPYGCDWVHTPNFKRLENMGVIFDNCYVGSMPCMPARRELHTGRYNFLHRSWGPIEPFDDSMPEILQRNNIYSHLVSDHYHYWEDGGSTYHTRFNSWEFVRGQEGDPWKGEVKEPEIPEYLGGRINKLWRQDWVNRKYMQSVETHTQTLTLNLGLDFIETNRDQDNWFLQIECFDPHEPFFTHEKYKALYPHVYKSPHFDWPNYKQVREDTEAVEHVRYEYAALVSMCDESVGRVLDIMEKYDLWKDTMLIVNTDHGYLLSEHGWWGKCVQPFYNEVAHIPFFIWDPRSKVKGVRRKSLVQTIDIVPTILDFFGIQTLKNMQGISLKDTIESDKQVRESALFGMHGGHVNCTDGRYVYMRAPVSQENKPLHNYTLMPTHMRNLFTLDELKEVKLAEPFSFTKGCKTIKTNALGDSGLQIDFNPFDFGTMLFDLENDPTQEKPLKDDEIEHRMILQMVRLMKENDCPPEQYERLGLREDIVKANQD